MYVCRVRRARRTLHLSFAGHKLEKDFYNAQKGKFNISKVPDIYDSIKYDLLHNKNVLQVDPAMDLYLYSKALADLVVPQVGDSKSPSRLSNNRHRAQEYGMTVEEKMSIARGVVTPLLRKIRAGPLAHDHPRSAPFHRCRSSMQFNWRARA